MKLKKIKVKEKDLQKTILDYLRLNKYIAVKFNSSIFVGKSGQEGRFIKSPQRGVADILACSPKGKFIAIEVKVGNNKLSESQEEFLEDVKNHNGISFVAYSLDDVFNNLV